METAGREHGFTQEVLNFRSTAHQFGKREIGKARILGRDQIRHDIGDPAIVFRGQQAFGAKQVVVQKSAVGERAADIDEEPQHLLIIQSAPTGQRDLERSEAHFIGVGNSLTNRCRGQSDNANLRKDVVAACLLVEDLVRCVGKLACQRRNLRRPYRRYKDC